jgi:hypothetical protein
MNPIVLKLYRTYIKHNIAPEFHRKLRYIYNLKSEIQKQFFKEKILKYSNFFPEESLSSELVEIINFLDNNPYTMFPYDFIKKYVERQIPVYYDSSLQMVYIVENDKKFYFKSDITKIGALNLYNAMGIEQDVLSPHRYLTGEINMIGTFETNSSLPPKTNGFTINSGDIVVDLGVAEGNFAFSIIDIVSKIYLFECDPGWIRALEATFKDYNDKVVIVPKYVSDFDDQNNISLDSFFSSNEVINFIKADIEGAEWRALQGMKKTLVRNTDIRTAICTYHNPSDAHNFSNFFCKLGFDTKYTPGYCLINDKRTPYLRKAVLRAAKKKE